MEEYGAYHTMDANAGSSFRSASMDTPVKNMPSLGYGNSSSPALESPPTIGKSTAYYNWSPSHAGPGFNYELARHQNASAKQMAQQSQLLPSQFPNTFTGLESSPPEMGRLNHSHTLDRDDYDSSPLRGKRGRPQVKHFVNDGFNGKKRYKSLMGSDSSAVKQINGFGQELFPSFLPPDKDLLPQSQASPSTHQHQLQQSLIQQEVEPRQIRTYQVPHHVVVDRQRPHTTQMQQMRNIRQQSDVQMPHGDFNNSLQQQQQQQQNGMEKHFALEAEAKLHQECQHRMRLERMRLQNIHRHSDPHVHASSTRLFPGSSSQHNSPSTPHRRHESSSSSAPVSARSPESAQLLYSPQQQVQVSPAVEELKRAKIHRHSHSSTKHSPAKRSGAKKSPTRNPPKKYFSKDVPVSVVSPTSNAPFSTGSSVVQLRKDSTFPSTTQKSERPLLSSKVFETVCANQNELANPDAPMFKGVLAGYQANQRQFTAKSRSLQFTISEQGFLSMDNVMNVADCSITDAKHQSAIQRQQQIYDAPKPTVMACSPDSAPMLMDSARNFLNEFSDSDSENEVSTNILQTPPRFSSLGNYDATTAFAKSLSRSREQGNGSVFLFPVENTPEKLGHMSSYVPCTPSTRGPIDFDEKAFSLHMQTPPGAAYNYESTGDMYATGMTPYCSANSSAGSHLGMNN